MRNTKKLIAVIMTIAILASMMVPALAASNTTQFEALKAAGLMLGTGEAVETDLAKPLNRIQGFVLVVRAMGVEATAAAMTEAEQNAALATVEDADMIPAWGRPHAAYAVANGLTNGVGGAAAGMIKFAPTAPLTGLQFITMMLRAMNYTGVTLANCVDKAIEAGMLTASQAVAAATKASFLRDDAALVLFNTVKGGMLASATGVTAGATKLIDALVAAGAVTSTAAVAFGYVAPTPAPAPLLTVSAVSATNLREIHVQFNQVPDKTTAETATNYVVSAGLSVTKAELTGDTVKLTLDNAAAQQANLEITFKNIKSAAGVAIVEGKKTITMFDVTLPSFVSYQFTGPQTIELTYSEPISDAGTAVLNNGVYGASAGLHGTKNNVVVVSLGTIIPEGTHTLKMTGVKDDVYTALETTISLNFVLDKTAPTVTLSKATQTSVTLTFSKDVKGLAVANFYHTYTSYAPTSVKDTAATPADVQVGNYYNEVVLDFTDRPLPAGNATVAVLKAVGDVKVTDRWGNVMAADAFLTAVTTADTVAPTITKVEATAETTVEITYSEDMKADTVTNKANYVFKKADGTTVTPAAAAITYADKKATVTFAALAGGTYTVTVSGVKDASLNANAIATVTQSFVVSDKTPITTFTTIGVEAAGTASDFIYVTFPELMATSGAGSVVDLANYKIGTADPATAVAFPSGTTITVFGTNDKVKITVPGTGAADLTGKTLYVRNVADAAGNVITSLYIAVAVTPDSAPAITAIKTTAKNKLDLTVNKHLSNVAASDIVVGTADAGDPIAVAFATYVNNSNGTATISVILNADEALPDEGALPTSVQITAGGNIKSITGTAMDADPNVLAAPLSIVPTDAVAPVFVKYHQVSASIVIAEYTEAINEAFLSLGTYTVADNTVSAINTAVSLTNTADAVNSRFVKITLGTPLVGSDSVATVTQVTAVRDVATVPNSLAAFAAAAAADLWAPGATATRTNATTVSVVFTEVVDKVAAEAAAYTIATADAGDNHALTSATLSADGKTLTLVFSGAVIAAGDTVTVPVTVKDLANNVPAAPIAIVLA